MSKKWGENKSTWLGGKPKDVYEFEGGNMQHRIAAINNCFLALLLAFVCAPFALECGMFDGVEGKEVPWTGIPFMRNNPLDSKAWFMDKATIFSQWESLSTEKEVNLYDDFDGHGGRQSDGTYLAEKGKLSSDMWHGYGKIVKEPGHQNAVKLTISGDQEDYNELTLVNPQVISLTDFRTFSADVMLPSVSSSKGYWIGLIYEGEIKILGQEAWSPWMLYITLGSDGQSAAINCIWYYQQTSTSESFFVPARLDTWYNLRIDIKQLDSKYIKIDFLLDDQTIYSILSPEAAVLTNAVNLPLGPRRSIRIQKEKKNDQAIALVDNVKAVYSRKMPAKLGILYDNFETGSLNLELWDQGSLDFVTVAPPEEYKIESDRHGYVMKVVHKEGSLGTWRVELKPLESVPWGEIQRVSFDLLLSSKSNSDSFPRLGLDIHGISQYPRPASWFTGIEVRGGGSKVHVGGGITDNQSMPVPTSSKNLTYFRTPMLRKIDFDKWYNLRMDIASNGDKLRLDFFVNDILLFSETPQDHGNPGPDLAVKSHFAFQSQKLNRAPSGDMIVFIDNVHISPPIPLPPLNVTGQKAFNRSLLRSEYLNVLKWEANPNNQTAVEKYSIYQIEGDTKNLIIELDSNIFEYRHHNVRKETQYTYCMTATNRYMEGTPTYITIE